MVKVQIIKADGTKEDREFTDIPSIEQLHEIIGGYVELIPMRFRLGDRPAAMYVDEDGKPKSLPRNDQATMLTGGFHVIVGTAVLVQLGANRHERKKA